jgi:hypothetical protein
MNNSPSPTGEWRLRGRQVPQSQNQANSFISIDLYICLHSLEYGEGALDKRKQFVYLPVVFFSVKYPWKITSVKANKVLKG